MIYPQKPIKTLCANLWNEISPAPFSKGGETPGSSYSPFAKGGWGDLGSDFLGR